MANRLTNETSLYLRQHADNPVDWFPWGAEAMARAQALNRPIFLSIGYSACHWCHVMEHESFEDDETAALMNAKFVNIKVDREERPDLDQIYMTAHQLLSREGGGWPLSVFLTPNLKPFFAGTYFPPRDAYGRPSFRRVLNALAEAWANNPDEALHVGEQVAAALSERHDKPGQALPTPELLPAVADALLRIFDPKDGGFGRAPKFPHAMELDVMLRVADRTGHAEALNAVRITLSKMARGGIYDQIAGGFHRYSVDAVWLVPHFEKMLYDNALLPPVYANLFLQTREPFFRQVACETLDFMIHGMTSDEGGFYATLDADSEGEEGKFYVWQLAELQTALGPDLAALATDIFSVTAAGNFEGTSILWRERSDEDEAARHNLSLPEFQKRLGEIKTRLVAVRARRIKPGRDEKIVTAWNGLMIRALAQTGMTFEEPRYIQAARRAADYVLARSPGKLTRTGGDSPVFLDDYAILADALISLYEACFDAKYLFKARDLIEIVCTRFSNGAGGFYATPEDHESLIARPQDRQDGSTPSGAATATNALLRLAVYLDRSDYRAAAEAALASAASLMSDSPMAAGQWLLALDFAHGPIREVVVVGPAADPETQSILQALHQQYRPRQVVAYRDPAQASTDDLPLFRDRPACNNRVTTYICHNNICAAPLVGLAAIEAIRRGDE